MKPRTAAVMIALAVFAVVLVGVCGRSLFRANTDFGTAALTHTGAILAYGPRPPGSPALERVRAYLAEQLQQTGWTTTEQAFERNTPAGQTRFTNLRARRALADPAAAWTRPVDLLLGCHIDSKSIPGTDFLGADDAASAAAAILVIAGNLAAHHPDRSARIELVFFDGEEAFGKDLTPTDGLYGSRHYARELRQWNPLPRYGIILDMVGHRNLSIRIPSDTPEPLRRELFDAARDADAGAHFGTAHGPIIDDHVPLNQAGVPTIDIIGDFANDNWWHTSRDNLRLLSPESLDASIRTTLRLIERLLK